MKAYDYAIAIRLRGTVAPNPADVARLEAHLAAAIDAHDEYLTCVVEVKVTEVDQEDPPPGASDEDSDG